MMCPRYRFRLALIHMIMLKVVVLSEASSLRVLPVMCESIPALAPLITLHVIVFRVHASEPYARIEQHPAMYSRILRSNSRFSACRICLSFPARVCAIAILRLTSGIWSPFARRMDPRYSKDQQFTTFSSPHITCGRSSCSVFSLSFFTSSLAFLCECSLPHL